MESPGILCRASSSFISTPSILSMEQKRALLVTECHWTKRSHFFVSYMKIQKFRSTGLYYGTLCIARKKNKRQNFFYHLMNSP